MPSNPNKPMKLTDSQQVFHYMESLEHPLKKEIEAVRAIILHTNEQLTEHIKWNAPSFCMNQEDRITFNLQGKGFFRLVFHCGAKAKDQAKKGRLIEDTTGLLDWATNDRATVKLTDMEDVESKREKLAEVITMWLAATS